MFNIVDLNKYKEENKPHFSGIARCIVCKNEWAAVTPMGTEILECPACGLHKGFLKYEFHKDEPHWKCNCGCELFKITPDEIYCPNCGTTQKIG